MEENKKYDVKLWDVGAETFIEVFALPSMKQRSFRFVYDEKDRTAEAFIYGDDGAFLIKVWKGDVLQYDCTIEKPQTVYETIH
jgi:hypothetical protein